MTANHKSAGKKEARVHTGVHACMHCRHTNQICLKCGTLKEERAPVCIKYSCGVFWGTYMCVYVCGYREKKSAGKLRRKHPAIERWHLVWQSEGEGAGLREKGERERKEEGLHVCMWDRERGRERRTRQDSCQNFSDSRRRTKRWNKNRNSPSSLKAEPGVENPFQSFWLWGRQSGCTATLSRQD